MITLPLHHLITCHIQKCALSALCLWSIDRKTCQRDQLLADTEMSSFDDMSSIRQVIHWSPNKIFHMDYIAHVYIYSSQHRSVLIFKHSFILTIIVDGQNYVMWSIALNNMCSIDHITHAEWDLIALLSVINWSHNMWMCSIYRYHLNVIISCKLNLFCEKGDQLITQRQLKLQRILKLQT